MLGLYYFSSKALFIVFWLLDCFWEAWCHCPVSLLSVIYPHLHLQRFNCKSFFTPVVLKCRDMLSVVLLSFSAGPLGVHLIWNAPLSYEKFLNYFFPDFFSILSILVFLQLFLLSCWLSWSELMLLFIFCIHLLVFLLSFRGEFVNFIITTLL